MTPWSGAAFISRAAQGIKTKQIKRMKDTEITNMNDPVFLNLVKVTLP